MFPFVFKKMLPFLRLSPVRLRLFFVISFIFNYFPAYFPQQSINLWRFALCFRSIFTGTLVLWTLQEALKPDDAGYHHNLGNPTGW